MSQLHLAVAHLYVNCQGISINN